MLNENSSRLLIKFSPKAAESLAARAPGDQALSVAGQTFRLEPLFEKKAGQLAIGPHSQWMLATASGPVDFANQWDLAHQALASNLGFDGALESPLYVEPDLLHEWLPTLPKESGLGVVPQCAVNPANENWPHPSGIYWHLDDSYSQLRSARNQVQTDDPKRVRILHLDTGYDPQHITVPENINATLAQNFVEGGNNAHDPGNTGTLRNPGHGTATLGLLAGNRLTGMAQGRLDTGDYLGGAPHAEIIPVRIANSVVHFWTSTMARGIAYAVAPDGQRRADVISISMGGVASLAWADAVNAAYEAGVCIVAAAGNNYNGTPTREIIFPARFQRVIAACGVTADYGAYCQDSWEMQGNFGPSQKMHTAMAAYSPNVPWATYGCSNFLHLDGAGTSAATPQVAAAAALWLQFHQPDYQGQPWKTVEAVRSALFNSTKATHPDPVHFGRGLLQASEALKQDPQERDLQITRRDTAAFALFRAFTGLGLAASPSGAMLELEALQLVQKVYKLAVINEDFKLEDREKFHLLCEAMIIAPETSVTLRNFLKRRFDVLPPPAVSSLPQTNQSGVRSLPIETPAFRRLRVYAFDPSLETELKNAVLNRVALKVQWETDNGVSSLQPGPIGEYIEVIDFDPASKCFYEPVDLDNPYLLALDGLEPSEGNPQFHQQMVYAVCMSTIRSFEEALGRKAFWAPKPYDKASGPHQPEAEEFVQRLRVYPHALREQNAYYSQRKIALLFGYFPASNEDAGEHMKRGMVYTCLSHDIIAHETTHALLDGMHRRFSESSNPDVLSFHEAFADIVALFQHFSLPDVLRSQIAQCSGNLETGTLLAQLALQFGKATGLHSALRDAIGKMENGVWVRVQPDPSQIDEIFEPHRRGQLLVAAVFDAFLAIYEHRTADLLRIATQGTGVLPAGAIHPDLVNRLAHEAASSARHVLTMCIRALDYCPPVDLTFGDYLRALITADLDLVPYDEMRYRVAVIEAFRRRGIYPRDVRGLSESSLLWNKPLNSDAEPVCMQFMNWLRLEVCQMNLEGDRKTVFENVAKLRGKLHEKLEKEKDGNELLEGLILKKPNAKFEVHSLRPVRRIGPRGKMLTDIIIEITQRRRGYFDPKEQNPDTDYDFSPNANAREPDFIFRGGATLIIDTETMAVRYYINKDITSASRLERQRQFEMGDNGTSLRELYFGSERSELFAFLHSAVQKEDTAWEH